MIAVLGATGTIGRHVARELSEHGTPARAIVRDTNSSDVGLPTVQADLLDRAALETALEGVTTLFLLTPHGPDQETMERNAVDAALAAGVERIVKISGSGPSLGPNGVSPTAVTHWRSEQRIESELPRFQFLRPSFLMQNLLEMKPVMHLLPAPMGHGPIAMVDARDVAKCAVALLEDEDAPNGAWQVTGPAPVTFAAVAKRLHARYVNVPLRLAEAALRRRGKSEFEVDHAMRMARYFGSGADGATTQDVFRLTGSQPRTLDDFLEFQHAKKEGR